MMRFLLSFYGLFFITLSFSHNLLSEDQEVLQPSIKTVDRDWTYYESIPCKHIDKVVCHSTAEERLLAKRKGQCMDRYKAFYSKPKAR